MLQRRLRSISFGNNNIKIFQKFHFFTPHKNNKKGNFAKKIYTTMTLVSTVLLLFVRTFFIKKFRVYMWGVLGPKRALNYQKLRKISPYKMGRCEYVTQSHFTYEYVVMRKDKRTDNSPSKMFFI